MSSILKRAGVLFLVFCICIGFLSGMLSLCAKIPNSAIRENMIESALAYKERDAFEIPENGRLCGVSDNFADAILLGVAWNMGEYGALDTKYNSGGEFGANAGLYLSLVNDAEPDTDYSRYWHGNAGIARIMHLVTDVDGMKTGGLITILFLAMLVCVLLLKAQCIKTCSCFFLALISVHIWNVRLSLEYQPAFVVALLMCILFLLLEKRGTYTLCVLSVIGGVLTAFFDFLTCETIPILLPLALVFAVRIEEKRGKSLSPNIKLFLLAIVCFALSYAGAFLSKWVLASLVTGENKFILAAASAGVRFGAEDSAGFLSGIPANLTVLFGGSARIEIGRVILGVAISAAILSSAFYLVKKNGYDRAGTVTLLIVGAMVFLRYAVLQNHSYLHEFFTYRALATTVFSVLAAVALSSCADKNEVKKKRK